jgi:signal transduction histidine kinase
MAVGPTPVPDEQPRIFKRFYRGARLRSREVAAGLVAVSRSQRTGVPGQIEASKLPNGGARFTVRLPLSQADSVPNSRLQHMPSEDHAKDERYRQRETHAER